MTNKAKFLQLVSPENPKTKKGIEFRRENRLWLRESQRIATMALLALDEQKMSQKNLAGRLGVSPQYVSKLVKGQENLTLDTITKLQQILGIAILASTTKVANEGERLAQAFSHQQPYSNVYEIYSSPSQKTA